MLVLLGAGAEGRVAGTQFSYLDEGYVLSGDGDDHLSMERGEFWRWFLVEMPTRFRMLPGDF